VVEGKIESGTWRALLYEKNHRENPPWFHIPQPSDHVKEAAALSFFAFDVKPKGPSACAH
jgi:hypothetical protein